MIENITEATGIKAAVEIFSEATGIDCGCDERKELLNKIFPINRPKCMTKDQFDDWKAYRETRTDHVTIEQRKLIASIHADIFNHKYVEPCTCSPKKWISWIKALDKVFETYGSK